jgi:CheY-like chemotaxis protein
VTASASIERERTHVLVVDDEPHVGRIIQMKLEQGTFRVTLAFD